MYNSYLLLHTSQYINYFDLKNIIDISKINNSHKNYLFDQYIKKANIIKRFFKMSHGILKNIDSIELYNTKLWGLFYFKYYEKEHAEHWIEFPCDWKFNIIKNSKSYNDIIKQNINVKFKLFKVQQNLTVQDIEFIGW